MNRRGDQSGLGGAMKEGGDSKSSSTSQSNAANSQSAAKKAKKNNAGGGSDKKKDGKTQQKNQNLLREESMILESISSITGPLHLKTIWMVLIKEIWGLPKGVVIKPLKIKIFFLE